MHHMSSRQVFPLPTSPTTSDSPVTMETGQSLQTLRRRRDGRMQGRDSACHSAANRLAVRAHRAPASPAVSGSLREQTGGGEEEGDERKEERTGGGRRGGVRGWGDEGDLGPFVY